MARFCSAVVVSSENLDAVCRAMFYLFRDVKLVAEPAALLGPLRDALNGKRVGLIVCG